MQYFGTDGIRGRVGEPPISADWVLKLGWAVGSVLTQSSLNPKVLIGKDTRISGYLFESALEAGLCSAGVDTRLLGPMPTPGIAYLTRTFRAQIGIVISASHNPYYDNGLKFFSAEGTKLPDAMESRIEAMMQEPMQMVDSRSLGKASRINDAEGRYIEFCKSTFPSHLQLGGLKLVLDCAHGATYRIAPCVFRELGAEIITLGVQPDGFNINKDCGSTNTALLSAEVIASKADLGIAFDGDGDRVILVDAQGVVVDGDQILYMIAKWYQQIQRLQGAVIGTIMSNYGLEKAFQSLQIPFERVAVGDRHILRRLEEQKGNLGGEASGHIICLDANSTGDGIVCALKVLAIICETGHSLANLAGGMRKYPQTLINVPFSTKAQSKHLNAKQSMDHPDIHKAVATVNEHLKGQGRVLLRASGTEPLLRVMVEGEDAVLVQSLAEDLAETIKSALEAS